jgi:hypothetical protein
MKRAETPPMVVPNTGQHELQRRLHERVMLAGLPYTGLCDAIFAHPTMVEDLVTLFSNVPPRSGQ